MIDEIVRKEIKQMPDYPAPAIVNADCKLNQNESPFDLPDELKEKISKAIISLPLNRYYDGSSTRLKEKLAKKFEVKSGNILVGAGIDELLYYLVLAFVNKGDKIVRTVPSFSMYKICSAVAGAKDTVVQLDENFELTEEFVKESEDAKITFICRPNNPTGNSFDKKKIERIVQTTSGIVCIDEAYGEFASENCLDLLKYKNVVIMRTFSKIYSGAALRIGYAIADEKIIGYMNKIRLPWNISLISQVAGEIILDNEGYFEQNRNFIVSERERIENEMKKIPGIQVYPSDCNFILFRTLQDLNTTFQSLLNKGILIRNLERSGMKGFLRVNAGTKQENDAFLACLKSQKIDAVIFDIDGVLVDVSNSYRLAIKKTAEKFLGREVTTGEIDKIKSIAGFNNDWDATYAIVKGVFNQKEIDRNTETYLEIKNEFQNFYLNEFMKNEKLLIKRETLQCLKNSNINLGIVTSRPREEALSALQQFIPDFLSSEAVVALEDCDEEKPSAKPLLLARNRISSVNPIYIGDSINDKLAAERAKIQFISVVDLIVGNVNLQDVNELTKFFGGV
ncbi:MAG: histidinol-phosphate transaminase [Candidatus Micrarchaeota archaeon]|nr:histidinol-phosphate transaminase [Candidatus Micrarchaeota archaeon]